MQGKECKYNANLELEVLMKEEAIDLLFDVIGTKYDTLDISLVDALVITKLCQSRWDAKRAILSWVVYVTEYIETNVSYRFTEEDIYRWRFLFIRKGDKRPAIVYKD